MGETDEPGRPPLRKSANSSQRLMCPMPPGDADASRSSVPGVEPGTGADPPRADAARPPRQSRAPSSELMDAGEPDDAGDDGMVVVARLSTASSSGMASDVEEALRSSGVGLMETKVRYSQKSRQKKKEKARRSRAKGESLSSAATAAAAAPGKGPEVAATVGPVGPRSSGSVGIMESKEAMKRGRKRSSCGAAAAASASEDGPEVAAALGPRSSGSASIMESKEAMKRRRNRSSCGAPSNSAAEGMGVEVARQQDAVPGTVESSIDEDDLKPGAVAIFPSDMSPSERDADVPSYRSNNDGLNHPYVDIMAEAHLVEEEGSEDGGSHTHRHGRSGDVPTGNDGGADDSPPAVPLATAKRVSPLVRFAHDHCLLVSALVLLVLGGIAGLSAYLATRNTTTGCQGEGCGGALTAPPRPTASPTLSPAPTASRVPSGAPTAGPTGAPTLPCNVPTEARASAVSAAAAEMVSDPLSLEDGASAHSRARAWLAERDAMDPPLCPGRGGGDASRLRQRFGLALLHFALGGEPGDGGGRGWTYKSSEDRFLGPNHECDWAGVDCNSDTQRVTKIELGNRNMRGILPAELFTIFEDLRVLNLQDNRLRGCLPDKIGASSNLEFLYLNANELTCSLPRSFGDLTELREIELFDNGFQGTIPQAIFGLGKLQRLFLGKNDLSGTVGAGIKNLTALTELHLNENALNSSLPSELFELSNLVSLRLSGNFFESTLSSAISQLSELEELYLHNNLLSGDIPDTLFTLGAVKTVALSNNIFSGVLPEQLGAATTLKVARFENNDITGTLPSSVSQLKELEVLSIHGTNIGGIVGEEICALKTDVKGGSGSLRRFRANCDEDYENYKDSICGDWGVCCTCCDCIEPEPQYGAFIPPCYPYGETWETEGLLIAVQEGSPTPSRSEVIIQKIIQYDVSEATALLQPSSPQGMAVSWISNNDELQLDPTDISFLQRYTMAVLYFSTEGDSWIQCSANDISSCGVDDPKGKPFLSNVSACEWAGVECYDDSIYSIRLEYNSLGGSVPAKELSGLCLDELSFRGNRGISIDFNAEYIPELFSGLYELDLSESALSGQLSEHVFYPQTVYLNDNHLNGTLPTGIGYWNLWSLSLQYNQISGRLPSELGSSGGFRNLRLDNNLFTGMVPETLSLLYNLELLTLHNNELSGVVPDVVCDLTFDNGGELEDLWADCGDGLFDMEIECSCCTRCFN